MNAKGEIQIVVVEDNLEVREYLEDLLNEDKRTVLLASYHNCNDAIAFIPQLSADVVILDIGLPDQSGVNCVKELKEQGHKMEFIMHTVFDTSDQVFEALKYGATGYLLKSTSPEKLISSIIEVYNGGSPMSPSIARKVTGYFDERKTNSDIADVLTVREYESLKLLSKGKLYKEIAQELGITIGTVKQYNHKIYQKLHVQNKTEAINKFLGRS